MSPVAPLVHLLAIAAGLFGGLWLAGEIAPDLPGADTEPGVVAPAEAGAVEPHAAASLLRSQNLGVALDQLSEQLSAGGEIVRLRIEPGSLESTEGEGGFEVADVPPFGPSQLVSRIQGEDRDMTLGDLQYVELVQTREGPEWYVQLVSTDPKLPPPWTYGAPLDVSELQIGGAPPKQISP